MHLVVWGSASKATVRLLLEGLPEAAVQRAALFVTRQRALYKEGKMSN